MEENIVGNIISFSKFLRSQQNACKIFLNIIFNSSKVSLNLQIWKQISAKNSKCRTKNN